MARSEYLEAYLSETASGRLVTPGSFFAGKLRGRAKAYAGQYRKALVRALEAEPGVQPVKSVAGGVAYVRVQPDQEVR